ncbi:uncharacterized protein KGF55_003033 [Candida pseudojiufengensis]|uniref:uncharacterized protein n=1 Tax=Candida pseudojiufengensis TaxID=497109 RepID=UPI00222501DC|nr:uncharacterized protein KGF55_003033 [Candida pseudojiufengensis]KAI5963241.1 hypothetical protein KGF55_003033 [Candida pseudojiufengensis]
MKLKNQLFSICLLITVVQAALVIVTETKYVTVTRSAITNEYGTFYTEILLEDPTTEVVSPTTVEENIIPTAIITQPISVPIEEEKEEGQGSNQAIQVSIITQVYEVPIPVQEVNEQSDSQPQPQNQPESSQSLVADIKQEVQIQQEEKPQSQVQSQPQPQPQPQREIQQKSETQSQSQQKQVESAQNVEVEPEQTQQSGPTFLQEILNIHNQKRSLHGVPNLQWDETLYNYAQNYANKYTCSGTLIHSGGPYGENIALGYKDATSVVEAWYSEIKGYDFNKANVFNHMSQIIWKSATKLGCAKRSPCINGMDFWICSYDKGNLIGSGKENILPLI